MSRIRILSDRVANQIAAGEVIERPAAVVKELVENAIDAGATRVEVEFRHGGRSYMRIEDNGCGMTHEEALLSLERHATSKINEAADLDSLGSFGFRGEALPSIASVSRFTMQTRTADSVEGTEILVDGGRMVHVRACGRPVGTRMEVAQLFNSVPARRKFLKTDRTESAHIITGVRLYALAFPQVSFTLIEDGRVIFKSPECPGLSDRVSEIFGRQLASSLIPVEVAENGMKLSGLIAKPGEGRPTRHEMITFINRRPVDSRALNYALIESYHESLPKGRYPAAFVFFEIDPAAVDVNVHPAKREVRFRHEAGVRSFVIRALLQRLREENDGLFPKLTASPEKQDPAGEISRETGSLPRSVSGAGLAPKTAGSSLALPRPSLEKTVLARPLSHPVPMPVIPSASPSPRPVPVPPSASGPAVGIWRFLGLAQGGYALFETGAGIVVLDRRAAEERIWFERIEAQFADGRVEVQRLLFPVALELDPIASALLIDRRKFLLEHGFEISEFGRNFFRLEGVPVWMEPAETEPFVRELLGAFRDGSLPEKNLAEARAQLARMGARRAARLSAHPSSQEMNDLAVALHCCRFPHVSPAGKPTYIELGQAELNRRFQR